MSARTASTVLVVEDNADLADLYSIWLDDEYEVHTAYCAEGALSELSSAIDVVLLDRRLPGMPGEEFLQHIREQGVECRVAMVTAVEPDFDVIEMGFDDYLVKPVRKAELQETVAKLLELDEHDALVREYFALSSKLAALESAKPRSKLEANDDYVALCQKLEQVRTAARDHVDSMFATADDAFVFRAFLRDANPSNRVAEPLENDDD